MAAGQSRAEEGQGAVGPMICAAGVSAAEMACGVDPGTSVLEGSNIQENWATDFGGAVGGGGGNKAGEAEDVLDAISSGGGSSRSNASARGGQQWQLPKPLPPPLVRMSLSSLLSSSVGVSKPIIISLNFVVLVLP
jgi:hypothetical protein